MEIMFVDASSASVNTYQHNFLTLLSSKYRIVMSAVYLYATCIIN